MWFILLTFLFWRIGLFVFSWWGSALVPFAPRFPYADVYLIPSGLPHWLWAFANFDGVHYLAISRYGYTAQFTQVFFPLQPLILRFLHTLIPFMSDVLAGIIFSTICFFISLYLFRKLLLLDYHDGVIRWVMLFLLLFPTAFYFGSLYTESVFFLLMIASFYFSRTKRWVWAGIFGGLAAATRIIGIFLLPALLWEQWEQKNFKFQISNFKLSSLTLCLIPLGLFSYMTYLQIAFGDWLYFWHAQPVFGAQRSGESIILLPQVIWRYGKILTSLPVYTESFWIAALELVSTLGCLGALYAAYHAGVRRSYIIFSACAVLVPTLTGTFSSMPRYILMAFPMYIVLGTCLPRNIKIAALIFSSVFLIILTVLFTRGHWVA